MDQKVTTNSEPLGKAVEDLERAEAHLKSARAEEAVAEREVAEAIDEIREAERDLVTVHVVHVNEVQRTAFKEKRSATLQQVWDEGYLKLEIPRNPKDVFQTAGEHPKSLMSHLNLTLEQALKQGVIDDYRFGIASETGGA
jgi:hypothetical protein